MRRALTKTLPVPANGALLAFWLVNALVGWAAIVLQQWSVLAIAFAGVVACPLVTLFHFLQAWRVERVIGLMPRHIQVSDAADGSAVAIVERQNGDIVSVPLPDDYDFESGEGRERLLALLMPPGLAAAVTPPDEV